jgi:hypothetical protein
VSRKALAALCQLIGLTLSQATHAQGNSAAALTNDGNYIARLSWERELVSGLDAQRLLLSIESTGQGTALEWQQLQVAAERRVHIMVRDMNPRCCKLAANPSLLAAQVMGADTDKFMHVHLEVSCSTPPCQSSGMRGEVDHHHHHGYLCGGVSGIVCVLSSSQLLCIDNRYASGLLAPTRQQCATHRCTTSRGHGVHALPDLPCW